METYEQALKKVDVEPHAKELRDIHQDHQTAAQKIEAQIRQIGGEPSKTSGAWGAWAKTVQGTAKLFGDTAALKALKEGEEHGLKDYESTAKQADQDPQVRQMFEQEFIPMQRRHIQTLDRLMATLN